MSSDEQAASSWAGTASGEESSRKRLRSSDSRKHSFVRFRNVTERRANIIWINYEGQKVSYHVIRPNEFLDVNTFETHPWVFEDADSGDKLVARGEGEEVFYPLPFDIKDGWPPTRKEVKIRIPVYSLEQRSVQVVRDTMTSTQVNTADIPQVLRQGIQAAIAAKHHRTGAPEPRPDNRT